jgi:hypothetical protein
MAFVQSATHFEYVAAAAGRAEPLE